MKDRVLKVIDEKDQKREGRCHVKGVMSPVRVSKRGGKREATIV